MSVVDIERTKSLVIKVYGQEFKINPPSVELMESQEDLASGDEKTQKEIIGTAIKTLVLLGMPEDFVKKMEFGHLTQLMDVLRDNILTPKKKD